MKEDEKNMMPREKALAYGMKSLTDSELMALIFGTGVKGRSVFEMCDDILADNKHHLSRVSGMSARAFMARYKGIGPAKALTLLAGLELGVRAVADEARLRNQRISSSQQAFDYMHRYMFNLDHEEFWVLMLSNSLRPIREIRVGQGGLTATAVDVKVVMREALECKASAMMLFHNHPSGTLAPSQQDSALTKKIVSAAALFDIRVLDHIIVGGSAFYSFHDEGQM